MITHDSIHKKALQKKMHKKAHSEGGVWSRPWTFPKKHIRITCSLRSTDLWVYARRIIKSVSAHNQVSQGSG